MSPSPQACLPAPFPAYRVLRNRDEVAILDPGHPVPFDWCVHSMHASREDAFRAGEDIQDSLRMLAEVCQ